MPQPEFDFPHYDTEAFQGSDFLFYFIAKDERGVTLDLAGASCDMMIRRAGGSDKFLCWVSPLGCTASVAGSTYEFGLTGASGSSGDTGPAGYAYGHGISLNAGTTGATGITNGVTGGVHIKIPMGAVGRLPAFDLDYQVRAKVGSRYYDLRHGILSVRRGSVR